MPNRQQKEQEKAAKQKAATAVKDDRLELMFTIVNRSKAEYYIDLLQSFEINMQLIALGEGTANADMLTLFGLADSGKAILMGVIKQSKIKQAFEVLDEKFRTIKNGKGIAYTVPMTGIIGTLIFGFLSNNQKAVKDEKENK